MTASVPIRLVSKTFLNSSMGWCISTAWLAIPALLMSPAKVCPFSSLFTCTPSHKSLKTRYEHPQFKSDVVVAAWQADMGLKSISFYANDR